MAIFTNYAEVLSVPDMPRRIRKPLQAAYRNAAINGGVTIHDVRYAMRVGDPFHEKDRLYLFPVNESRIIHPKKVMIKGSLGERELMPQLSAEIAYMDDNERKSYILYFCINPETSPKAPLEGAVVTTVASVPFRIEFAPRIIYVTSSAVLGPVQFAGFGMNELHDAEWILSKPRVVGVEISERGEELFSEVVRKDRVLRMGNSMMTLKAELFEY